MTDSKPYLIRAIYEWICDNEQTPYIYIETRVKGLLLPENLYADNPLILNISPSACQNLNLANESITFQARFSGRVFDIYLPVDAVIGVVARENGQGMTFEVVLPDDADEHNDTLPKESTSENQTSKQNNKRGLKIVK